MSPEPDGVLPAAPDEARPGGPSPGSRLIRAVVVTTARGSRPVTVLLVSVAVEAVFLAAFGAVQQARHILGIPGSLMALTVVAAGATGGPVVGSIVALIGSAIYYVTVAGLGSRGGLLPTLILAAIWVSSALISAFLSEALRRQARERRAATASLAEARATRRVQGDVARLHEAFERQLVPPAHVRRSDLDVITRYVPTEGRLRLGGDFVDVMSLPRKGLALIIGDVSGHGPAAAALGATLRATWQGLVMSGADRATIRATLDATMIRERRDEDACATACLAWIDPVGDRDRLHCVNIAHPLPLLVSHEVALLAAPPSLPMGVGGEADHEPAIVTLTRPWSLMFYTDGLVEGRAAPGSNDRVGVEGLVSRLRGCGLVDEATVDALLADVEAANGGRMNDDVALIVVSRRA